VPDAAQRLDRWVTDAAQTTLPQLVPFANGLTDDRDAVIGGLTTPWSSGKVEGIS
jgi:transposase